MTEEGNWSWWVGYDEERFHTECESREEAIQIAIEEHDGAWIVEAQKPENILVSDYFDEDEFLEQADERANDDHGDPEGYGEVIMVNTAQGDDLKKVVTAAIDEWQKKHNLVFTAYRFSKQRNLKFIPEDFDPNQGSFEAL